MREEAIWVEKYRPRTVEETILPDDIKARFQAFVNNKTIPHLLLNGRPGMGKTTIAKAMLEELGCDYITINASMNGGIDTLRNEITNFATTVSFQGGRKYVILDEADHLTALTQASLRNFMESYSSNCGFILTCNMKNRIIDALHSRCTVIDFVVDGPAKSAMSAAFFKRMKMILDKEGVTYEPKAIVAVIQKQFPDFRKILNSMQSYGAIGHIDANAVNASRTAGMDELFVHLKDKKFDKMREWVGINQDMDFIAIFRDIYDVAKEKIMPESIPGVVVLLASYMDKHSTMPDQEINMAAFLTEIMYEAKFV